MNKLEFINVFERPDELHELCTAEGWTDLDVETWIEKGGDLQFFEGDPDIIKVDGQTGYFCEYRNKVFYYLDDWTGTGLEMLKAFFEDEHQDGIECGDDIQSWTAWDGIENGIAYRGGRGYVYNIFNFSEFVEKMEAVAV